MTVLKICGIKSVKDRDACLACGVDLLGFNIYPGSARYAGDAGGLKKLVTDEVKGKAVIVGVNMDAAGWQEIITEISPSYIQMHGDEKLDTVKKVKELFPKVKIIKKIRPDEVKVAAEIILNYADFVLCDSPSENYGGTGRKYSWSFLDEVNDKIRNRMFMAGGVNAGNVRELLKYNIYGVDVASGSEVSPGVKDFRKVKELARKVMAYE